ncbi:Chitin elicitor receptor kinase 1-like protein [Drosera capensis]
MNQPRHTTHFFFFFLLLLLLLNLLYYADSKCSSGCDLALASYTAWSGTNFTFIASVFDNTASITSILSYNTQVTSKDSIVAGTRYNVPFSCSCIDRSFLGTTFTYTTIQGDTYTKISDTYYANLTTVEWTEARNSYSVNDIPTGAVVNVTVNCSCGDARVSREYGLFITYPLAEGDTLESVAKYANISNSSLLQEYNPGVNFSAGSGLVYIPTKDASGSYRPLTSKGISPGVIAGIIVAVLVVFVAATVFVYIRCIRRKKIKKRLLLAELHADPSNVFGSSYGASYSSGNAGGATAITGITVDKSVEFSYEELAKATDDFSLANKIGQGGFGAVYYAELRGENAAIKKMDMQATKEFLAELKVLTHVHHLNLVRLIGYCVEGSLFLVYEYIDNGNLSQHLRGSGRDPLLWSARVQIALDSARGLEYIHEHTVPVYIHRDIKSANILIDKNFHAKVADFGLAKLTEVGTTRLVGTFGYMPPEYAQYGEVSAKVDVYAFGVVLYELISAKEAVVKDSGGSAADSKGLVGLASSSFEEAMSHPDPDEIRKLVDPRLEDNYPLESVIKMAQLAKACTQENAQLRPSMRSVVVALMTLSSTTEVWDVASFYENKGLVNLMSGR